MVLGGPGWTPYRGGPECLPGERLPVLPAPGGLAPRNSPKAPRLYPPWANPRGFLCHGPRPWASDAREPTRGTPASGTSDERETHCEEGPASCVVCRWYKFRDHWQQKHAWLDAREDPFRVGCVICASPALSTKSSKFAQYKITTLAPMQWSSWQQHEKSVQHQAGAKQLREKA